MSQGSPENGPQIPPMPDIQDTENLRIWMQNHIKRPPAGYDDMRNPDGTPLTPGEQIEVYIKQTIDVINLKKQQGTLNKNQGLIVESINSMLQPTTENTTSKDM